MKITKLEIHNYRNLNGMTVSFDEKCNFIVGENNLGKSNLLSLLNILFSSRSFHFEDFEDTSKPIEIGLQLRMSDIELGHFEDLFDTQDYSTINLICRQMNLDDNIEFYHKETNTYIQPFIVRCINYVHYDSLRNPVTEISFDKARGVGRFLRNLVSQYLEENNITEKDFLNPEKIDDLLEAVNDKLLKIKSFKDFDISATPDDDLESLLSKALILKDGKGDNLSRAGYGIQFLILVTLSILEKIQFIKQQRKDRGIFEDEETGNKAISLVLGLDEPEIHLHPYMQRSLIKYLNAVITNQNPDFKSLIKELFDIDEFVGQIIVVTHSPNIILNDYKQIVRFFSMKGITKIISGSELTIDPHHEKHLYLHFPFIKEAFFSRSAIFVEGDTEYASFPLFAQKLSIEFDDLGISVIQAGGEAIPELLTIASSFGISAVGVTDKGDGYNTPVHPNHYQTDLMDFEDEIVSLVDSGKESLLRSIVSKYDSVGEQREMTSEALNKRALEKYGVVTAPYTVKLKLADISAGEKVKLKSFFLTWLSINKSYPLGKFIGETFTAAEVPAIYKKVILEAKKLVENV